MAYARSRADHGNPVMRCAGCNRDLTDTYPELPLGGTRVCGFCYMDLIELYQRDPLLGYLGGLVTLRKRNHLDSAMVAIE